MLNNLCILGLGLLLMGHGSSAYGQDQPEPPSYEATYCEQALKIDGKLNDATWAKHLLSDTLHKHTKGTEVERTTTELYMTYDEENLYVAFKCYQNAIEKMETVALLRDQIAGKDDAVKIALDIQNSHRRPEFEIGCNSVGVKEDLFTYGFWDPNYELKTSKDDKAWYIEMAIPLSVFGKNNLAGEIVGMNVTRRLLSGRNATATLVPSYPKNPKHKGRVGPFTHMASFGHLYFKPKTEGAIKVVCETRGQMQRGASMIGLNEVVYHVSNNGKKTATVEFEHRYDSSEKKDRWVKRQGIKAGETVTVKHHYAIYRHRGETVTFSVHPVGGKTGALFNSTYAVEALRPLERFTTVKDGLFEEVLDRSQEANPEKVGAVTWYHHSRYAAYLQAIEGGHVHDYEKIRQRVSDVGFHELAHENFAEVYGKLPSLVKKQRGAHGEQRMGEVVKEHNTKGWSTPSLYAYYHVVGKDAQGNKGVSKNRTSGGFLPDPINTQAFVDIVMASLDHHKGKVDTVMLGNEQVQIQKHTGEDLFKTQYKPGEGFLHKAHEEMKQKYGFGKYALPSKHKRGSIEARLEARAFNMWLIEKLANANRKVYKAVKTKYPHVRLISDTSSARDADNGIEFWSEYSSVSP